MDSQNGNNEYSKLQISLEGYDYERVMKAFNGEVFKTIANNPQSSTNNPQSSTNNPQSSTNNPQSSTNNPQSSTNNSNK